MVRLHGEQPEPLSSLSTRRRRSAPLSLSLRRRGFPIPGRPSHRQGSANRIPPPKAVCPDLLIGVKSMAYVMRYNHFPD